MMTFEEAFNEFDEYLLTLRCGDNSCLFGRYPVGTNGGCQTLKSRLLMSRVLTQLTLKWQELKKQIADDYNERV